LKILIKYNLVRTAFMTIIPSLLALLIIGCVDDVPWWASFAMGAPILVVMVAAIYRIVVKAYYALLQHEPSEENSKFMDPDKTCDLFRFVDKRYNVDILKKKLFPKAEGREEGNETERMKDKFDRFIYLDVIEDKYDDDEMSNYFETLSKERIKFKKDKKTMLKKIKPMVQAPNQIIRICINELTKYNWDMDSVKYSIVVTHEFLEYAKKQQDETKGWNKISGRSKYSSPNDSWVRTLYGILLYCKYKEESALSKSNIEKIREIFSKAVDSDVDNELAKLNETKLLTSVWLLDHFQYSFPALPIATTFSSGLD
jgi:hypothetical protein